MKSIELENKKERGRPKKFSTEQLKDIVKAYALKNKKTPILIKASALAKYGAELGYKIHYQDFTRNSDIMEYINQYNDTLKKVHLKVSKTQTVPIHSTLDINKFLLVNNTPQKLKGAIQRLDETNADLVEKYGQLEKSSLKIQEENLKLKSEIESLKEALKKAEYEKTLELKEIKEEKKSLSSKNKTLRKTVSIYESFIKEYHLDTIAQQILALEGTITSEIEPTLINKDRYDLNNYDLSEVISSYNNLVQNQIETSLDSFYEATDDVYDNDTIHNSDILENDELVMSDELENEDLFDDLLSIFD